MIYDQRSLILILCLFFSFVKKKITFIKKRDILEVPKRRPWLEKELTIGISNDHVPLWKGVLAHLIVYSTSFVSYLSCEIGLFPNMMTSL